MCSMVVTLMVAVVMVAVVDKGRSSSCFVCSEERVSMRGSRSESKNLVSGND
jgi:hypothetical protein